MSRVSGLVVGTSVWIDFFDGRPVAPLEHGLADGVVVLPPVVVAELISGARHPKQRAAVVDLIADLAVHETPSNTGSASAICGGDSA